MALASSRSLLCVGECEGRKGPIGPMALCVLISASVAWRHIQADEPSLIDARMHPAVSALPDPRCRSQGLGAQARCNHHDRNRNFVTRHQKDGIDKVAILGIT